MADPNSSCPPSSSKNCADTAQPPAVSGSKKAKAEVPQGQAPVEECPSWTSLDGQPLETCTVAVLNGSKNQADEEYRFGGTQCVPNCAAAIVQSHHIQLADWDRERAFDPILREGNAYYEESWFRRFRNFSNCGFIYTKNLAQDFTLFEVLTYIKYVETDAPLFGLRYDQNALQAHMTFLFSMCNYGIVIAGGYARGVIKQKNKSNHERFYLFDPHGINTQGLPVGVGGRATIFSFVSLEKLIDMLFMMINHGYKKPTKEEEEKRKKEGGSDPSQFTIDPIRVRFPSRPELDDNLHVKDMDEEIYLKYIFPNSAQRDVLDMTQPRDSEMANPASSCAAVPSIESTETSALASTSGTRGPNDAPSESYIEAVKKLYAFKKLANPLESKCIFVIVLTKDFLLLLKWAPQWVGLDDLSDCKLFGELEDAIGEKLIADNEEGNNEEGKKGKNTPARKSIPKSTPEEFKVKWVYDHVLDETTGKRYALTEYHDTEWKVNDIEAGYLPTIFDCVQRQLANWIEENKTYLPDVSKRIKFESLRNPLKIGLIQLFKNQNQGNKATTKEEEVVSHNTGRSLRSGKRYAVYSKIEPTPIKPKKTQIVPNPSLNSKVEAQAQEGAISSFPVPVKLGIVKRATIDIPPVGVTLQMEDIQVDAGLDDAYANDDDENNENVFDILDDGLKDVDADQLAEIYKQIAEQVQEPAQSVVDELGGNLNQSELPSQIRSNGQAIQVLHNANLPPLTTTIELSTETDDESPEPAIGVTNEPSGSKNRGEDSINDQASEQVEIEDAALNEAYDPNPQAFDMPPPLEPAIGVTNEPSGSQKRPVASADEQNRDRMSKRARSAASVAPDGAILGSIAQLVDQPIEGQVCPFLVSSLLEQIGDVQLLNNLTLDLPVDIQANPEPQIQFPEGPFVVNLPDEKEPVIVAPLKWVLEQKDIGQLANERPASDPVDGIDPQVEVDDEDQLMRDFLKCFDGVEFDHDEIYRKLDAYDEDYGEYQF